MSKQETIVSKKKATSKQQQPKRQEPVEITTIQDPRSKGLSSDEREMYEGYGESVGGASREYRIKRESELRKFGIEPQAGVLYGVYVGGSVKPVTTTRFNKKTGKMVSRTRQVRSGGVWEGFGGKQLSQWEKQQRNIFFTRYLPEYRQRKTQYEYEKVEQERQQRLQEQSALRSYRKAVDEYAKQTMARHELALEYAKQGKLRIKQKREQRSQYKLWKSEMGRQYQIQQKMYEDITTYGLAKRLYAEGMYEDYRKEVNQLSKMGKITSKQKESALAAIPKPVSTMDKTESSLTPYQISEQAKYYGIQTEGKSYEQISQEVLEGTQKTAKKMKQRSGVKTFVVAPSPYQVQEMATKKEVDVVGKQYGEVKTELGLVDKKYTIYETQKPIETPKSITQQIFEFDPFEAGQEFALNIFGVKDEQKRMSLKEKNIFKGVVKQAGKGLPLFDEPTKTIAGVVGTGESLAYIPPALMGKPVPYVPTFSGAAIAESGAAISGQGGGDTQKMVKKYGVPFVAGSIAGDVILSYAAGKGISLARKTKIGGKVLNPILKPLDKADEIIGKKVITPIKEKATAIKQKIIPPKPKITGFERGAFGAKGYQIKEIYGPSKQSIFKSNLPSVIKDETGEKFITQTARATSYPTTITGSERTVIGGGKPWIAIMKSPPSKIGGGLSRLVSPSTVTKVPSPAIASLKTKIAPQLIGSLATKNFPNYFATATVETGIVGARQFVQAPATRTVGPQLLTPKVFTPEMPTVKSPIKYKPYLMERQQQKEQAIPIMRLPQLGTIQVPQVYQEQTLNQQQEQRQKQKTSQQQLIEQIQRQKEISIPKLADVSRLDMTQVPQVYQTQLPQQLQGQTQIQKTQQVQVVQQIQKQQTQQKQKDRIAFVPRFYLKTPKILFDEPKKKQRKRKPVDMSDFNLSKQLLKYPIKSPEKVLGIKKFKVSNPFTKKKK